MYRADQSCQYFEGFKSPAESENPKGIAAAEDKDLLESEEISLSDVLLTKKKELDKLKSRLMEKDQELHDLESALTKKGEERKAEIESLKNDLGHERQAWMTPGDG